MSWLFSQALVEEFSAGTCSAGEPCAQLNVMPTPHKFWRRDKTMDASDHSRFGLTSQVLTADRGAELLMSYLAGFHARTSAAQATAQGLPDQGQDYGNNLQGWFSRLSPDRSQWKTPQISLLGGSELFLETWPRSGLMLNGMCFQLPTLAHTICVSASGSLLPTLTVNGNHNRPYPGKKSGQGLVTAIRLLPTLTTIGLNGGSNSRRATAKRGEPPTHIGPLNPVWCEWFMGFPMGWTELKPLAMDKFREWQRQHSHCSPSAGEVAA
ncbi:hypothetical protein SAMN05216551_107164 [Chitinasiproducens palmae]|uniref:Uncharacterized protein n=1 Tax=Chitinasiproducens palmae TaxID=1770053 RepID=A0A1H2PSS3_9BURK|nr:hypothetical protein [Chitinasiproducens palmae]SDV49224.1 hypothetical protein SAMN05216551_107164 [Chitinasiproducens palmae]